MLKSAFSIFLQDLNAIPQEAFTKSFGGTSRTVADIVFEMNMVNDHVGMVIREEKPFDWPEDGWITAPKDFNAKEAIIQSFKSSSDKFVAMIEGFSEEQMDEAITTESGETNRAERCRFVALHTWYHSGQLNFMQTLLGDTKWHWS